MQISLSHIHLLRHESATDMRLGQERRQQTGKEMSSSRSSRGHGPDSFADPITALAAVVPIGAHHDKALGFQADSLK